MADHLAHIDFETFSEADPDRVGAHVYAAHPSTDILCMAWALHDEEPSLWLPGQPFPDRLGRHVAWGGRMTAHNAAFERLIWCYVGMRRYDFPVVDDEQWWCTAAQAAAMALPRALDEAAAALGNAQQKDLAGRRIMLQVSQPRKPTKTNPMRRWTPEMAPEKFAALYDYCLQDVRAERGIGERLYALSAYERRLYLLDQQINDRGIKIDRTLIQAAKRVTQATLAQLDAQLAECTGGFVAAHTQVGRLAEWLRANGLPWIDGVSADAVRTALARADRLPWNAEKALLIRQEAAKSSTAKLDAMLDAAGPDDRIRGSLLFCGAARTRRWSGRLHQPQNFPRGDEVVLEHTDAAVAALLTGNADAVRVLFGNPMVVVSSCLRPCMIADSGRDLMACDFAQIESRALAWCSGETWKLDAFRAYDAGTGPDLYKVGAGEILGKAPSAVTKTERQSHGKVPELACGYQGWVGAFQTFAALYNVKISDDEAAQIAGAWRRKHPNTVAWWYDLNDAAIRAVARPGHKFDAGPVTYLCANNYLWCRLPSGGVLAYARPTIERNDRGEDAVHFWTVPNPQKPFKEGSRKWAQISGYGGMWAENIVQAVSRDLLADAMLRLDAAGYPLVLTVHDELVAEVPHGVGTVQEMEQIAADSPSWAAGLPVVAEGWRGFRYRK